MGGEYRGRKREQEQEWKAGRHDERKASACRSGVGAAPRACVYIAAIYSIFIYIIIYISIIYIISIYLIIYINIIPFSSFLSNTSVLYVKNSIYINCKLLYINVLRVFPSLSFVSLPPVGAKHPTPPGLPPCPPHPPFPLIFYFFYFSEVSHAAVLHFLLFSLLFPPYFRNRLFAHLFAFCRTFISFLCSY